MLEGGCYCGAVRFKIDGDPLFTGQCHCRECQYITGGHPNVVVGLSDAGLHYTHGRTKEFKRTDLENAVTREFCAECGTHMISRNPGMPGTIMVKAGVLDDPSVFGSPQMAIYTIDRQTFHHIPDGVPTFERLPGSAEQRLETDAPEQENQEC